MTISEPGLYIDTANLNGLKLDIKSGNTLNNVRQAAQQFESLFMHEMLKSMRDASPEGGLFESKDAIFYRDMLDQQLSVSLSSKGGMGLADALVKQLTTHLRLGQSSEANPEKQQLNLPDHRIDANKINSNKTDTVADAKPAATEHLKSPQDLINAIWPHAQQAGKALDVSPNLIVAQAALETGWGTRIPTHPDGSPSFNLFGIKADNRWQGQTVTKDTLEFDGSSFTKQRAHFRAYDSLAAGVTDFANSLQNNPRYQTALEDTQNDHDFAHALQDAGYATDPNYANKIINIMNGPTMEEVMSNLKNNHPGPLAS